MILYIEYSKAALTRDWVRIFMFSGLRGESINKKYLEMLRSRILEPVAVALREEFGLPDIKSMPLKTSEIELVWSINARIFTSDKDVGFSMYPSKMMLTK